MKSILRNLLFVASVSTLMAACSKDDDEPTPKPTITMHELGSDNSKIAYTGSDLHVDAEIVAPGNIASIMLEIHGDGNWELDTTYTTGFAGLKNVEFHEHVDIPAEAPVGRYHFHLVVTDQRGQQTTYEDDLEIKEDPTLPTATGFEIGLNTAGDDLHVEASITAPNKIAKVVIEVHGSNWEKEFEFTDVAMVGQTTYNLHKHLNVGAAPAGHYHVHMKVVDQAGKEREFEEHFDK